MRRPRKSASADETPLGSLTQPGARAGAATCRACGGDRVTRIGMSLTDGSYVQFTSCHTCEHRSWTEGEECAEGGSAEPTGQEGQTRELSVRTVLDKTRKHG